MSDSEVVIREVAKGVWIFSRPFIRLGILPIGGRSVAIRLQNGGLWVLASTPLDAETKAKLDELGDVRYIVGAGALHNLFLGEFKRAYPTAKLIAPEPAVQRQGDKTLHFDGAWGRDPPTTEYGFENEIHTCYFSAFRNKDVAFFHLTSKSLIVADLVFNLPCKEQHSRSKASPLLGSFAFGPGSWIHSVYIKAMAEDYSSMKRDVKTVSSWGFSRIIPCHGDVIERNGKEAWTTVYHKFLD